MWLKSVRLQNIKSFADSGVIEFSPGINLLVGANNAGKSTILRAIYLLQSPENNANYSQVFLFQNLRAGGETAEIELRLAEPEKRQLREFAKNFDFKLWQPAFKFVHRVGGQQMFVEAPNNNIQTPPFPFLHQREPHNFIYPYFCRRKPAAFQTGISPQNANVIEEVFEQLPCKIDRLSNRDYPSHESFRQVCRSTLGLNISSAQYGGGKQAGLTLHDGNFLPIDNMGEGTISTLILLAHLCSASGKLFLMEEIENDLHPKALKRLLEFIIERSATNQFIVCTHNNIVTKFLGSAPKAKLFSVEMRLEEATGIPTSSCRLVSDEPEERIALLESLGYEPFDFYLWKGYLFLEESTAERLIREFFIPFLIPDLQGKLATIAAKGISDVQPRFIDFMRVFVFIHTSPQYKERGWVAVDGGEEGETVIASLQSTFKTWPKEHFRCFKAKNFEEYYPPHFKDRVSAILSMTHGKDKKEAKGQLVQDVLKWALEDIQRAQKEFAFCAKEVLDFLREISAKLTN